MTKLTIRTKDGLEFVGTSQEVCQALREASFTPSSSILSYKENTSRAVRLWNSRRIRYKSGADAFLLDMINAGELLLVLPDTNTERETE